jgi:chromosome segregation ATPase
MGKRYSLLTGQEIDVEDEVEEEWPEVSAMSEARKRIIVESQLATLTVRLQASRDALLMSETRMATMEAEKQTLEARLRLAQDECTRLEAQLVAAQSMRATADELINHIRSNAESVQHVITAQAGVSGDAPTFELSFVRDSAGRIKSPVTAIPRT